MKSEILSVLNKRFLMHFPVGVINSFVLVVVPLGGIACLLAFLGYEYIQEWRKVDHSYKDVYGFVSGFYLAMIGWCIADVLSVCVP